MLGCLAAALAVCGPTGSTALPFATSRAGGAGLRLLAMAGGAEVRDEAAGPSVEDAGQEVALRESPEMLPAVAARAARATPAAAAAMSSSGVPALPVPSVAAATASRGPGHEKAASASASPPRASAKEVRSLHRSLAGQAFDGWLPAAARAGAPAQDPPPLQDVVEARPRELPSSVRYLPGARSWSMNPTVFELDVVAAVLTARKFGPHSRHVAQQPHHDAAEGVLDGMVLAIRSASPASWYFVVAVFSMLVVLDITVLQQLPETTRTNLVLLFFWVFLGLALGGEIWLRNGPEDGLLWLEAYLLELVFSVDRVVMVLLIFMTLDTPRRLMAKALFMSMFTTLAARWLFIAGAGPSAALLAGAPYLYGLWLVYCGTRMIAVHEEGDEIGGVTQSTLVCGFRQLLGDRLGEFYDEDGEHIIVSVKQRRRVTLLGVALVTILFMDSLASLDLALLKRERIPSAFVDFTSAAAAFFTMRALFFVARDVINIFGLGKYCLGAVLFFLGTEMMLSQMFYISAVVSTAIVVLIVGIAAGVSWAHAGPHFKFLA